MKFKVRIKNFISIIAEREMKRMENRHLRPSLQFVLIAVVAIATITAIGTENTNLCIVSFLTLIGGLLVGNKLGV